MRDLVASVPLLGRWALPGAVLVAALAVGGLWVSRTRRTSPRTQATVLAAAVLVAVLSWWVVDVRWRPVADGVGWFVWCWVGVLVLTLLQVAVGPWRARPGRRGSTAGAVLGPVVCLVTVVLAALLAANAHFASFRTLGTALGMDVHVVPARDVELAPVPDPATGTGPVASWWRPPADLPAAGVVMETPLPASDPAFHPRDAMIYLPPAYLGPHRPVLPVLVLLAGVPGEPKDWLGPGELQQTMDAFAARHGGLAPVVVVPDPLGGTISNPLCSDAAGGRVATYLQQDVPRWVTDHLQVDPDHRRWAVGGISNGGTCAMQVVTRAPEVYATVLDLSGEPHPTLGTPERTLQEGYGGDRDLMAANDFQHLLATRTYPGVAGIVSVGAGDDRYRDSQREVHDAARRAGMGVEYREYPGGHAWTVWAGALGDQLPWLAGRLGLLPQE